MRLPYLSIDLPAVSVKNRLKSRSSGVDFAGLSGTLYAALIVEVCSRPLIKEVRYKLSQEEGKAFHRLHEPGRLGLALDGA
jgi:hypothetical protein